MKFNFTRCITCQQHIICLLNQPFGSHLLAHPSLWYSTTVPCMFLQYHPNSTPTSVPFSFWSFLIQCMWYINHSSYPLCIDFHSVAPLYGFYFHLLSTYSPSTTTHCLPTVYDWISPPCSIILYSLISTLVHMICAIQVSLIAHPCCVIQLHSHMAPS